MKIAGKEISLERLELFAAGAISILIVFLHGVLLFHAGPLWRDEAGTIDYASMPTLSDIWHNLQYDNFPPLFVFIARVWTLFGMSSDFSYRILGFLVGMATLGVIWFSARSFGARVPLLALSLYAMNPLAIRVGDSMRAYGLGIALSVLTMALMWRFVRSPGLWALLWAALAAVLSTQCLYQGAVFLVVFSLAAWSVTLARKQWKISGQIIIMGVMAAVALLPYLGIIQRGQEWREIKFHRVNMHDIDVMLLAALKLAGHWMPWVWGGMVLFGIGIAILFARGLQAGKMIYCTVAMIFGAVLYVLFLMWMASELSAWYFLTSMAIAALALDALVAGVEFPAMRAGRIGLALLLALACGSDCHKQLQQRQSNADMVAAKLKREADPHDLILILPPHFALSLQRYYGTNGLTTVPPIGEIRIDRYDLIRKRMELENPIDPLKEQIRSALRSGHAVWLVGVFSPLPRGQSPVIYPPFRKGMEDGELRYYSSWMFQIAQIVQAHSLSYDYADIPVPGDGAVNPWEWMQVVVFRGWAE